MLIDNINMTNLRLIRGDSFSFVIELEQDADNIDFTCKSDIDDNESIFHFYNNTDLVLTAGNIQRISEGKYLIEIYPGATQYIEEGKYPYDLQITIGNKIFTILSGYIEIINDVTRE